MKEILNLNQEKKWSFEPKVGELLIQNGYGKNNQGKDILISRMLMYFDEVKNPGESWSCCSLARTEMTEDSNKRSGSLISRIDRVKSDIASFLQSNTESDFIVDKDGIFLTYTKASEVGLNGFLYGMAKGLKMFYGYGQSEVAKQNFVGWKNLIKGKITLLSEEKERIEKVHDKVLRQWDDDSFWWGRL